ncbi:MAG TPA: hypothetical protein VNL18_05735, partial [Gemmatimonadales bacterium]|nr:hypothetical protein [Gemmatimonadales bacterium]
LRPAGSVRLPTPPLQLLFAADGASLYAAVSPAPGSTVLARFGRNSAAALLGKRALFGAVRRLVATPDGQTLLLALGDRVGLGIADAGTLDVERPLAGCDARDVVLTRGGERAYVLCADDLIAEVDPALRLVVKNVELSATSGRCGTAAGALSANQTVLFVACSASARLLYLDRVTLMPFDSVDIGAGAARLALSPDGRHAVVASPSGGIVEVVDVRARTVRHRLPLPEALDIAVSADGHAFVVGAERLWEVDVGAGLMAREVALGAPAAAVVVWPGPREPRMRWDHGR